MKKHFHLSPTNDMAINACGARQIVLPTEFVHLLTVNSVISGNNGQFDDALAAFEDRDSLLVRHVIERQPVDRENLVAALEPPIGRRRALVEDGLHVDREVSVRRAAAADDGEAETLGTALKPDDTHLSLGPVTHTAQE